MQKGVDTSESFRGMSCCGSIYAINRSEM